MNKVYHRIDNSSGSVINLRAQGVQYHELADVSSRGNTSLAQVIKIDGDSVSLQVFAGAVLGIAIAIAAKFIVYGTL
jgi:V/A-type H+-transporting ATPase subunit B